ncbi:hypothetical protein BCR34DRAFT_504701, partial [Clohesyomyces aquaticus]
MEAATIMQPSVLGILPEPCPTAKSAKLFFKSFLVVWDLLRPTTMAVNQKYELIEDEEKKSCSSGRWSVGVCPRCAFLCALVIVSISANIFQYLLLNPFLFPRRWSQERSEFAKIEYEHNLPWDGVTSYNNGNYTEQDLKWGELRVDDGIIALSKSYAMEKGLPPSEQFPWDSSKAIYLVNGYHGIHCLTQVYLTLKEYREGLPQSHGFEHASHCLDWLRNDIQCRADDTPLYMKMGEHGPENGVGQYRKCKDWSKLAEWAQENTACYRYGDFVTGDKQRSQIGRFKYCPKDSPYLPKVRKYF